MKNGIILMPTSTKLNRMQCPFLCKGILIITFYLLNLSTLRASITPTTLSGSSTYSVSLATYNSNDEEQLTMTISAGSGAGDATLVSNDFGTFTGSITGLTLFFSATALGSDAAIIVTFTDATFTKAVASWTWLQGTERANDLLKFQKSTGNLTATDLHASIVTGSTNFSTVYKDIATGSTEAETLTMIGDGDAIGTFDGNQTLFIYGRFFSSASIDLDGSYSLTYGVFEDDTYSSYIGFNGLKDADGLVQVRYASGSGSGSLSVSHTPMYFYHGTSLSVTYSFYEYNSSFSAELPMGLNFDSRNGEAFSGINPGFETLKGYLIGPVIITYLVNTETSFSLQIYHNTNYSQYFGHTTNDSYAEFSSGIKTTGDLSYGKGPNEEVLVNILGTPSTAIQQHSSYSFVPEATSSDNSTLSFSIQNQPSWASFNTSTGQLSGIATTAGLYAGIIITATSGTSSASLAAFSIEVSETSSTVSLSGNPNPYAVIDSSYNFTPIAMDTLEASIAFSVQNLPTWASFSITTGQLSGTPGTTGTFSDITITASNDNGSDSLLFSIQVVDILVGKETVYVTVGGISQPVIDGGIAPFQITPASDSTLLGAINDASLRDGFANKLLGFSSGITSITVSDASGQTLNLSATVYEATTANFKLDLPPLTQASDYKMVTFPLNVSSLTGSELFDYLENDFGTYGEDYILYTYKDSHYEKLNEISSAIGPGYGYWMGVLSSSNATISGASPSALGEFQIKLEEGWNLIGNPFSTSISTASIIYYKAGQSIAVESAAQNDLGHVFWGTDSNGNYEAVSTLGVGQGVWIYSSLSTSLIFPTPSVNSKPKHASDAIDLNNEPQPPARPKTSIFSNINSSAGGGGGCLLNSLRGQK